MYGQPQQPMGSLPPPGGYPQLRPPGGLPPGRPMASLPPPSAAVRTSMSPVAQSMRAPAAPGTSNVSRSFSGNLSLAPTPVTPQTTPPVFQNVSLPPGGQPIRGGSLSIPSVNLQPAQQSTHMSGLGATADPFATKTSQGGTPKLALSGRTTSASQLSTNMGSNMSEGQSVQPAVLSSRSYHSDAQSEQTQLPQSLPAEPVPPQWASPDQRAFQSLQPTRDDRSPSPELPLSHRYSQARVTNVQSPAERQLQPKVDVVEREVPSASSMQDRIAAAGLQGVYQQPRPRPAVEEAPGSPRQHMQSYQLARDRFEQQQPVMVQTQHREMRSADSNNVYHRPAQPKVHRSPPAQQVIPTRQPASFQHESTPPRTGGFLSSLSSDPVSSEKTPAFERTERSATSQTSSSRVQEPRRGIEFNQAAKPIWQRDEVVAPVILSVPLAGFVSTMLF